MDEGDCIRWGEKERKECSEYRDAGYNKCALWAKEYKCCDWWPCSWVCGALVWLGKWICLGWYWVSNLVCVAWTWVVETVCLIAVIAVKLIKAVITLVYTLIVYGLGIFRVVGWLFCLAFGTKDVGKLSMKTLQVEIVIIDKSESERNPITEDELDQWISYTDRIFQEEAKIQVKRRGAIRRDISESLYEIDASSLGAKIGEWFKGIFTLWGRDSIRYLTLYAVGKIKGAIGLHLPLYGSLFIQKLDNNGNPIPDTSSAHEIGHCLLAIWNTYHNKNSEYLMYTPPDERERAANWPKNVPKISNSERCAMRQSRWLDLSWKDIGKVIVGWAGISTGTYLLLNP